MLPVPLGPLLQSSGLGHKVRRIKLPATTLARVVGHSDPGFTLRVYAKDRRDEAVLVQDVLDRAQAAQIGG